ncbi:unnamed protein product [Didymodactylos carnosus]|uniref:Uncharacterized protein n=1 Tax=Didymodactylos carnosus TaxID=1234261 RepID=A0A8S2FK21_9BILA|nr:unnamed protein product [Didymodactylos carnosus]CAF4280533.1 unnamed protein product [Didymodactylos carnosus]
MSTTKIRTCGHVSIYNGTECKHCLTLFCPKCYLKHVDEIKEQMIEYIKKIKEIIMRYDNNAHAQQKWMKHLSQDLNNLTCYINCSSQRLPTVQWLRHIKDLTDGFDFDIDVLCLFFMELRQALR